MNAHIKLFRIFGIQVGLHYSWLLIAFLVVLSLVGQFSQTNPQWGPSLIWGVSIFTALLFFAAIVLEFHPAPGAVCSVAVLAILRVNSTRFRKRVRCA